MNYTTTVLVQYKYFNRKPSPSNTRTEVRNYAGFTYDKVIAELERDKSADWNRVISYTDPVLY